MRPVFFAQALDGIGYVRCILPARAIDAEVLDFDQYCVGKRTPEECWEPFIGRPAIFPLVANWARLHAMRDYRRITGAAVLVEVDDDYTVWSRGYIREQVKLGVLDTGIGWVEEDIPEYGHPNISSPHVHRRALAEADAVIVSTKHLLDVITPINPRTFICRNVVDPADWPARPPREDDVFRVMFSASPNLQDLALIRPAMEWAARQEGVEAIVAGYKPKWRGVREVGWVNNLPEYRATMAELRPDVWLRPIETTKFAKSKCLDADTLIPTRRGLLHAAAVTTADEVWSGQQFVDVRGVEAELGARSGLLFRTSLGYEIQTTPEHRLWDQSGRSWQEAKDFRCGDELHLSSFPLAQTGEVSVGYPLFRTSLATRFHPEFDGSRGESLPQILMDENWGELLGFFVGDGSVSKTRVAVACDGQDQDVLDRVVWLFNQFGLFASTEPRRTFSGDLLLRQSVYCSSSKLVAFLRSIGLVALERYRRTPCVPGEMLRSPGTVVRAFLRGYFEADGHNTDQGVAVSSKDKHLLQDVQRLLLGFGITSRLWKKGVSKNSPYADRDYWQLSLRTDETCAFAREIGFVSERKRDRLFDYVNRDHPRAKCMTWADKIEAIEQILVRPVDLMVDGEVLVAGGFISHNSDLKILEAAMVGALPIVTSFEPYMGWRETPVRYAATPKDWQQEVRRAIKDPVRVAADAAVVREIVYDSRVVGSARPEWTKAIQAASARRSLLVPSPQ